MSSDATTQGPQATRTGDVLLGWSTSSTATAADISDLVSTTALTLYAVWASAANVIYHGNGGTPSETLVSEAVGADPVAQAPTIAPTYGTNTFLGWSTNKNAQHGDALGVDTVPAGGIVMYAVWRLPADIQVLFFENDSQLDTTSAWQPSALVDSPSAAPLHLESTMGFSNPGYRFTGWCSVEVRDDQPCPATTYVDGETYSFEIDLNLYAMWTSLPPATVTFDANGGRGGASVAVAVGTDPFSEVPTAAPTRTGFRFAGWATSAGASTPLTTAQEQSVTTPSSGMTLYAVWTPLSYVVHYVTSATTSVLRHETLGADPVALAPTPAPRRHNYTFLGWSSTPAATTAASIGQLSVPTGGMTLYALWRHDATVPTPPRDVLLTAVHDGLAVAWSPPASDGGSPLTAYRVVLRPAHGSLIVCTTSTDLTREAYCPHLPSGAYIVNVIARNVIGSSTPARSQLDLEVTTTAPTTTRRASAPLDVNAHFITDVAHVTWRAPADLGGSPLVIYDVTVPGTRATCFTLSTHCTIAGLSSNVRYHFLVSAVTRAGNGLQGGANARYQRVIAYLEVVPFGFASAKVTSQMAPQVDSIARVILAHHITRALVIGYTDLVGSTTYDQALGEERAISVTAALHRALRARGLSSLPHLEASSRGKSEPVLSNYRRTRGASSRRVVVIVEYYA